MTGGDTAEDVGAVAIGRNEGARLARCLESLRGRAQRIVYVDSGSTDGSVEAARSAGADVVALDTDRSFTAARARNAGLAALCESDAGGRLAYVQFVDGDCEIAPGWIEAARRRLEEDPCAAVVCGRRAERFPEQSIYNRLCDMEWNTPVGQATACGGDALMRIDAVRAVGGFDATLIAGEEPDLCLRLRAAGWTVWRIDAPMTRHDAAMTRFGQWWRRAVRGGWAYAEGSDRHGDGPERYKRRDLRSVLIWGGTAPALGVAGALLAPLVPAAIAVTAIVAAAEAAMALRIAARRVARFGDPWPHAVLYGGFTMLGKLPQLVGVMRYHSHRRRSAGPARLIEYK